MKKSIKNIVALTGATALLVLAGCATDAGETEAEVDTSPDGGAATAEVTTLAQYDLSGISIAVGSKQFPEQLILGEMMVQAFQEAGADVRNEVNLGGTSVARAALEAGEDDITPEYNATGWLTHLGQENPSFDPDAFTQMVRELDLAENGIVWISRSPFNNTYGFASSPEITAANGGEAFSLQTMMEYVRDNPDTIVCMESEYPVRDDGLILTENATGIELPSEQQRILEYSLLYAETAANNCDFGEVYLTDGRISALGLTLVEDPGVNLLYNVSGTMRQEVYNQAPEAFDAIIEALLAPLDNDRMGALEAQVSVEGLEASDVAKAYLIEEGLISE